MRAFLLAGAACAAMTGASTAQIVGAGQTAGAAPASGGAGVTGTRADAALASANPLLAAWTGPYGGVPAFDKVRVADFEPALNAAMAQDRREVDAIADNPAPPTFDNTVLAMERSGRTFGRVGVIYGIWTSNLNTPDVQAIDQRMSPKLAAFQDETTQNARLFARIDAIYQSRAKLNLTPEQDRLVWRIWTDFAEGGAKLAPQQKAQLSKINQELAGLYTSFSQNELSDEETYALVITDKAQLAGLPQSQIDAAAGEAQRRGKAGAWVIANTRSSMEPFLTYSSDRALRQQGFEMWTTRGDHPGAHDNNPIVTRILALRAQKAQLLGYPTYAHWHLADAMAKTPDRAMALMMSVWTPAKAQVRRDVADMQVIVDKEPKSENGGGFKIQPWDYRYYAEKLRKAKYDLDLNEVKPYLQLEHVREAMFYAAGRMYGLSFTKLSGIPVFDPQMSVYEVKDRAGKRVGLWYFDPYARPGKNSGAWMNAYREQYKMDGGQTTIVSNNANFVRGKAGEPITISFDDAKTMFHEFGHALHGLNSNVTYPTLSGTNVARDYVEFPSQFNENYFLTPEVLKILVNDKGQPMPAELVAKIRRAHTFNQGFQTVEAQASALVDMKMHLAGSTPVEPHAFEKTTLAELGMPSEIVMRHRIPQFGHVFAGEGYAAGYYGYLWAEVLDHDAYEAFTQTGNAYDPATAKRFHDDILQVGDTVDPAVAYRTFRGRDATADALLRDHGFPVATASH